MTITEIITKEMWVSAILGAVVSAVFAGTLALLHGMYRTMRRLTALRQLLGPLGQDGPIAFFSIRLYSRDRTYLSDTPNFFPPHTQGQTTTHPNIPYVVGTAQMEAAADIMHLLGQVGRQGAVQYLSADSDWDVWDKPLFAVGGSHKTQTIFSSSEPRLVEAVPQTVEGTSTLGFRFPGSDECLCAVNGNDYGLILKTTYPPTGVQCFVLMGMGSLGTEAAAYFLRINAVKIGRAYRNRNFALLVQCRLDQGKQSARLHRWNPRPDWKSVIRHPSLWAEYRRMQRLSNQRLQADGLQPSASGHR
jgi:hypothetical protein